MMLANYAIKKIEKYHWRFACECGVEFFKKKNTNLKRQLAFHAPIIENGLNKIWIGIW
jgi:hypothetical protein